MTDLTKIRVWGDVGPCRSVGRRVDGVGGRRVGSESCTTRGSCGSRGQVSLQRVSSLVSTRQVS